VRDTWATRIRHREVISKEIDNESGSRRQGARKKEEEKEERRRRRSFNNQIIY